MSVYSVAEFPDHAVIDHDLIKSFGFSIPTAVVFCDFPAKTTSCLKITTTLYHFVIVVDECLSQTNIPN